LSGRTTRRYPATTSTTPPITHHHADEAEEVKQKIGEPRTTDAGMQRRAVPEGDQPGSVFEYVARIRLR
jgi:hypothetical protein